MTRFYFILIFSFFISGLFAQIPAGYYNGTSGLTGNALKSKLHTIIRGHTKRSYYQVWTDFQTTDKKANGKVWDMYSDVPGGTPSYTYTFSTNQCGTYTVEGNCYNREHSFPKSWWGGGSDTMYTDLFHLVPTDGYVNQKRGNYPFGEVGTATWTSTNGCKVGTSNFPGYSGTVFEPIDEYKGDFARNYFYMATRYKNKISSWSSPMLAGVDFSTWALNLLLDWNAQDPVSQKEKDRNDAIYGIQGNRNPFIDHPTWVNDIWNPSPNNAPVFAAGYPKSDNITNTTFDLLVKQNKVGTAYYVVLADGSSTPSSSQVKNGEDANGTSLVSNKKGSISISTANTQYSSSILGLSLGTDYDIYVVSEDNSSPTNLQNSPTMVEVLTTGGGGSGSTQTFTDLIISEYVEGSSNNKYLEIWNNTGASVNLSDYHIDIYFNGKTIVGKTVNLTGTLVDQDVYVIANNQANVWSGTPDLISSDLLFNGDDAVALVNTNAKGNIDVFGVIGNGSNYAKDKTLERNTQTTGPSSTYNTSEWDSKSKDDVSGLGSPGPLPIELISFTAKNKDNTIVLNWKTATETNNDYFTIERSIDADYFELTGIVNGAGNSNVLKSYQFIDNQTSTVKVLYYRLKQTDFDGRYSYSSIISLSVYFDEIQLLKSYISNDKLFFTLQSPNDVPMKLEIISLVGQGVLSRDFTIIKGVNEYHLVLNSIPKGVYILRLYTSSSLIVKRVLVN